ncbi:MAG TPA: hypothetical protein VGK73_21975 [Polyangiaceae bacterium]
MRPLLSALAAFGALGCLDYGKVDDAKAPGDLLGMYAVSGELDESSCGEGALGAGKTWAFDVKLTRYQRDLYWLNGREAIVGSIAQDGRSFTFESGIEVEVSKAERGRAACRVARDDAAVGVLSDSGTDVESFEGKLEFTYRELADSDCSNWIGTPGAVSKLPCSISYRMAAERQDEPSKR